MDASFKGVLRWQWLGNRCVAFIQIVPLTQAFSYRKKKTKPFNCSQNKVGFDSDTVVSKPQWFARSG